MVKGQIEMIQWKNQKWNLVLQILATHLRNFKMIFKNCTEIIRMQIYVFVCLNDKRISKNHQSKCKLKQK